MRLLQDIFTYAYRGSGKYILLVCVVLSLIAKLCGFAPLIGFFAWFVLAGYFCAVYFQMVLSTATGGKEAPEFPDLSNLWEDILWPMLQVGVVLLASFSPYLLYQFVENPHPTLSLALFGLGVVYFPMAVLAAMILGYTGAISPHIVLPSIIRGGWVYVLAIVLLLLIAIAESVIGTMLRDSPIIHILAMSFISAYSLMTNARILGVVYRERQEQLGWL
jgi:hypothetical protein